MMTMMIRFGDEGAGEPRARVRRNRRDGSLNLTRGGSTAAARGPRWPRGFAELLASAAAAGDDQLSGSSRSSGWRGAWGYLSRKRFLTPFSITQREWSILAEGLRSAEHVDAWADVERMKLTLAEFVDLLATTAAELPAPNRARRPGVCSSSRRRTCAPSVARAAVRRRG